jgi:hypothetical protein
MIPRSCIHYGQSYGIYIVDNIGLARDNGQRMVEYGTKFMVSKFNPVQTALQ